jgi:hypothetical protein
LDRINGSVGRTGMKKETVRTLDADIVSLFARKGEEAVCAGRPAVLQRIVHLTE